MTLFSGTGMPFIGSGIFSGRYTFHFYSLLPGSGTIPLRETQLSSLYTIELTDGALGAAVKISAKYDILVIVVLFSRVLLFPKKWKRAGWSQHDTFLPILVKREEDQHSCSYGFIEARPFRKFR